MVDSLFRRFQCRFILKLCIGISLSTFYLMRVSANLDCENVVSPSLKQEIKSYEKTAQKIFDAIFSGPFKSRTYNNLEEFVDKFGARFAGTETLERSLDFLMDKMRRDGRENVTDEPVDIPFWTRGQEEAELLTPRRKLLNILGLGLTVATPPEGITAPVLAVKTFQELEARASEVPGKIVVFNQDYGIDYVKTVSYRMTGAVRASALGAVACLVRSVTPFSIDSPHTGVVLYKENLAKPIPVASLTVEDAQLIYRMHSRGENVTVRLYLEAKFGEPKVSRNIIGDLTGGEWPEKFLVVGAHSDSWDVGEGAMDDAGGCFLALEMQNVLRHLKLTPKRTIRTVLFTAEEIGLKGAYKYVERHKKDLDKISAIMESDFGTFPPSGFDLVGTKGAACILKEILSSLLKPTNATVMTHNTKNSADILPFTNHQVPGISLWTDSKKYLWFHHTAADSMTVEDPHEIDLCLAVWTVTSYVLADLSEDLPRE